VKELTQNLLMIDSGAFSVWTKGETIDIDDYIKFCLDHPESSYYVNLDVIPGRPGSTVHRTEEVLNESARQGWRNYLKMISYLPQDKVIPVYHRGENLSWLEKYLDFGCTYLGIGLSGALGAVGDAKKFWLKDLRRYLFDAAGKPVIKTHGFAVMAWEMMIAMPWHSVDSASWVRHPAYGKIYIPQRRGGEWVYDRPPFFLNVSPKSPSREDAGKHIDTLSPAVREQVGLYLAHTNMKLGAYTVVEVPSGYKLQDGELWWDRTKCGQIMRISERGLMTCYQQRFWINMKFIHNANRTIDVDHIYFAGSAGTLMDQIEYRLKHRLLSYHTIKTSKKCLDVLRGWEELISNGSVSV